MPNMFAAFTVPLWIPQSDLLRFAKAIYPYWKECRIERGGHRIIPTLNVSLTYRLTILHLTHSPSSTMSQISKTSPTFASGGMMSRRCTRLVPHKRPPQKSFCV
jgi:hypothetical protein